MFLMKKSILGTLGLILVLFLVVGDRFFIKEETADDQGQTVAMADGGADAGMVIIEEGAVPLAASVPTGEEEDSGALSCLIDGNHRGVWTDCGDYKVMKCADCAQEVSERAYKLSDGVYGYYSDAAAMLLFSKVNDGRPGFELDGTLHEAARERALESAGDFSGDDGSASGECIARGQTDADAAIAAWNASEYHRNLLINPMYTEGGCSCLWYDSGDGNMKPVWVMILD